MVKKSVEDLVFERIYLIILMIGTIMFISAIASLLPNNNPLFNQLESGLGIILILLGIAGILEFVKWVRDNL